MPASHDLKGLFRFMARDEWRGCFAEVFDNHFGPVLEAGGMNFEDLAEILGDNWGMTLWGCAFEDFLTQEFDVGDGNIVDQYLRRRGWNEGAQAKAYMKGLRTSILSLYEVSDIVPSRSLMARDLIRGGEPIAVSEGTATKTLKQWDRVAVRIVPVSGKNVFSGGLLPYTPQASEALFDGLQQMFGTRETRKLSAIGDEELRAAAPLFTLSWLFDTLDRAMKAPVMQNADGDDLMFHDVRFPLAAGVTQKQVAPLVSAIPGIARETAKFWNWLEASPKGIEKARQAKAHSLDTMMDNGQRVLGNLELKGRFLHLSANSATRAANGTALIRGALGDLVRAPLTEIRTIEQMMADGPDETSGTPPPDLPPEIAAGLIHQYMDRHYRESLDQPVGMLGDTPRQVVKSASGRKEVAEWLKYLENQSASQPDPANPMASYSFDWMWQELGIADLRR